MNYKDYGEMIYQARKNKKYSQEKIAQELNVSRQAVSNWETNKCFPDVSVIPKLCNLLDINVYEFFENKKGEKILEIEKEKIKKKNKIILISSLFIIVLFLITIFLIINRNKFNYYKINIEENEYFEIKGAHFIETYDTLYLDLGVIENNIKGYVYVSLIKQEGNEKKNIYSSIYKDNIIIKENKSYNEYFESITPYKNKLYIQFNYVVNNNEVEDIYELSFEKAISSPKLLNFEKEAIGDSEEEIKIKNIFDKEKIVENGYIYEASSGQYKKEVDDKHYTILGCSGSLVIMYRENDKDYYIEYENYNDSIYINAYDNKLKEFTLEAIHFLHNKETTYHIGDESINYQKNIIIKELEKIAIK